MDGPTIWLIDDDPAVRAAIAFALDIEGMAVRGWASAEALLGDLPAAAPQCLVLDQRLPGIDGLSLLARLRARGVSAPAIVITTAPSPRLCRRAGDAGALLVEKPLLCDALVGAVRACVTPHPASVAAALASPSTSRGMAKRSP